MRSPSFLAVAVALWISVIVLPSSLFGKETDADVPAHDQLGSVLDFARDRDSDLLRRMWCGFDRFLNFRGSRRRINSCDPASTRFHCHAV